MTCIAQDSRKLLQLLHAQGQKHTLHFLQRGRSSLIPGSERGKGMPKSRHVGVPRPEELPGYGPGYYLFRPERFGDASVVWLPTETWAEAKLWLPAASRTM